MGWHTKNYPKTTQCDPLPNGASGLKLRDSCHSSSVFCTNSTFPPLFQVDTPLLTSAGRGLANRMSTSQASIRFLKSPNSYSCPNFIHFFWWSFRRGGGLRGDVAHSSLQRLHPGPSPSPASRLHKAPTHRCSDAPMHTPPSEQ